jgi:hypothetical protein
MDRDKNFSSYGEGENSGPGTAGTKVLRKYELLGLQKAQNG